MTLILDSFWRAAAYCLHPRVIALSFLPLVLMVGLSLGLGYFFWQPAVDWARLLLDESDLVSTVLSWLQSAGAGGLKSVIAPLLVIFSVTPLIVLLSLLLVSLLMTPALTALVAERRFPDLQRKKGGSLLFGLFWSLGSSLLALLAMVASMPLWLVPPLILILPPLIWGWLTYRVMSFDVLAEHASATERREIFKRHRVWLLGIGIMSGFLGAAPGVVWASGALFAAAFVLLVPLAIWIYTLVFAFSSLWFAHYALSALAELRRAPLDVPARVLAVDAEPVAATDAPATPPNLNPPHEPQP